MVDIFRRRRPQRAIKAPLITIIEWLLVLLTLGLFWHEVLIVFTALIDYFFPRSNLTTPGEIINAVLPLMAAFSVFLVNVAVYLFAFVRKAGFPVFGFDDLVKGVALEADDMDEEYAELLGTAASPTRSAGIEQSFMYKYVFGRLAQILSGMLHQLLWFFGLRGSNAVIERGVVKSTDVGAPHWLVFGSVISDFDSGFVIDSPQDEGDRRKVPPIAGWYGLRYTFRRGLRGSVFLDRLTNMENDVLAHTRDGIPVRADIVTNFTLSQPPECLEVALQRATSPTANTDRRLRSDDFRVVRSSIVQEPYPGIKINTPSDEYLDDHDKLYIRDQLRHLINLPAEQTVYQRLQPHQRKDFNRSRVFRAVSSQNVTNRGEVVDWRSLPVQIAKAEFSNLMLNYTFAELFGNLDEIKAESHPIEDINAELRRRVRNQGLLAFRLLWHRRSLHLPDSETAELPYRPDRVRAAPANSPYIDLPADFVHPDLPTGTRRPAKLLRARGIKVFNAAFENLRPDRAEIDQMRERNYSARYEQMADRSRAEYERQHFVVMSRAAVESQAQVSQNLLRILESDNPDEVVLLELISAMQTIINRRSYDTFLPRDVNTLFGNIERWVKE